MRESKNTSVALQHQTGLRNSARSMVKNEMSKFREFENSMNSIGQHRSHSSFNSDSLHDFSYQIKRPSQDHRKEEEAHPQYQTRAWDFK